jgi:hypothetical protein
MAWERCIIWGNVLYRVAGEERGPLRSNGIGEGRQSPCPLSLTYPIPLTQNGPLSSPASQQKTFSVSFEHEHPHPKLQNRNFRLPS